MPWIDIESEQTKLERGFDHLLVKLGSDIAQISTRLAMRIGIRPGEEPKWMSRLSPLTCLYPLLQAQGITGVSKSQARRASLGHMCLIIHSFIEDRQLDSQISLVPEEILFSKSMLLEGLSLVRTSGDHSQDFEKYLSRLMRDYSNSQMLDRDTTNSLPQSLSDANVKRISSGRAVFGVVATMSLAYANNCDTPTKRKLKEAFDCLATALQWADDCEDWHSDLTTRDENLLLTKLGIEHFDPYTLPIDPKKVGAALLDKNIVEHSISEARRWVQRAITRQRALGCDQLSQLIEMNFVPWNSAMQRQRKRADRDLNERRRASLSNA